MSVPAAHRLSPLHRLWRLLPAQRRRYLLSRGTALLAPGIDRDLPPAAGGMVVAGDLFGTTGLGEAARLIHQGLTHVGVPTWELDLKAVRSSVAGSSARRGAAAMGSAGLPVAAPLLMHVNAPLLPLALLRLPRATVRGRRVIGYWLWELPTLPAEWALGARFVHEAWVASRFTAEAVASLLPGRVRVVPLPLAITPPTPSALDRGAFGLPDKAVVVLVSFNLASSLERKNPHAAIAAFRAAFGDRPDRLLVLKVGNPGHFPSEFAQLAQAAAAPNIRLETRSLPRADNDALTASADIVLSLHRSEGFGLVPAEAMLLGKPVIATGWSGNMDFMDAESAALVGYRLVPARDPRGVYEVAGAVWAEPDQADAVAHLRRLADDAVARRALGARGRAAATARLGAGALAEAVRGLGLAIPGHPTAAGTEGGDGFAQRALMRPG
jgi:glycosyltransferase involved in cell wall biosynthesis